MHIKQIKVMKHEKHTHPTATKQQLKQKDERYVYVLYNKFSKQKNSGFSSIIV